MSAQTHKSKKDLIAGFISRLFCIVMIVFTSWALFVLLADMYFPERVSAVTKKEVSISSSAFTSGLSTRDLKEHFHNVDDSVFVEAKDPPLCMECHGEMPHRRDPEKRSFLNMHTHFAACEVCHVRKVPGDGIYFAWLDFDSGAKTLSLDGRNGNYNARIVPMRKTAGGKENRLDRPLKDEFAKEFISLRGDLSHEQMGQIKQIIHNGHSVEPVGCTECHSKGGYLGFEDLHYSQKRVMQLEGTEAAGMVDNYDKFHFFGPMWEKSGR